MVFHSLQKWHFIYPFKRFGGQFLIQNFLNLSPETFKSVLLQGLLISGIFMHQFEDKCVKFKIRPNLGQHFFGPTENVRDIELLDSHMVSILLGVQKFTANLYCICIDLRYT